MTPFKNFSNRTTFQNRIRRGSLYVAVSALLAAQISCGSDNGTDWEQVTTYHPTKGVITVIEETPSGSFEIVDEKVVESLSMSRVVIRKQNGQQDTLTLDQAKGLVQSQDTMTTFNTTNHSNSVGYHPHNSIGSVLWGGALGYMMGRSFSSPTQARFYRPEERRDERNGGSSSSGGGRYYGGGYNRSSNITQELRNTATPHTTMRPVNGRSGFFGGGSRSSSRGSYGG
jgi:hypothetical protein